MNAITAFSDNFHETSESSENTLRIYRKHAARAISEERWSVAEIFFDRILDLYPRNTEAWLMKGFLQQYCKQDDESALRCFRKVISLCGFDSEHPHLQRARASMRRILRGWV